MLADGNSPNIIFIRMNHDFNIIPLIRPSLSPSYLYISRWVKYIWVRSWMCSCLVTWFCYQLRAKPCIKNSRTFVTWPIVFQTYLLSWQQDFCELFPRGGGTVSGHAPWVVNDAAHSQDGGRPGDGCQNTWNRYTPRVGVTTETISSIP